MKRLIALAVLAALPLATRAHADDPEIAVIVHPGVSVRTLRSADLEAIFTSAMQRWPDRRPIIAFHYAPEDPLRRLFDRVVLRMSPEEVGRFWVDQRIRGGIAPPRRAPSSRLMARVVAALPGSIGYVAVRDLGQEPVRVVARIRGGSVTAP